MITPSDIVNHLAEYLPRISDKFSDSISILKATISQGRKIVIETTQDYTFSVGDPILFIGGQTPNNIQSVANDIEPETLLIEFSDEHDFTTPNDVIKTESLPCVGFNESEWNTTLSIIGVPTDSSVIVEYPTGATGSPTFATATGYEERPLSIFGTQVITSVYSARNFTVELSSEVPALPDGNIINLSATVGARIAAADTIARAEAIYSKVPENNDLWAFVIMLDTDVSKDRHTLNDSVASFSQQNEMRLRTLNNFSIVVFFRTANNVSGVTAQELAYGEVYTDLLQVLYGFGGFATDDDNSSFVTVTTGHGVGNTNTAYYTHIYDWQLPVDITIDNGFRFYKDVACRDIDSSFGMFTADSEEKLTIAISIEP